MKYQTYCLFCLKLNEEACVSYSLYAHVKCLRSNCSFDFIVCLVCLDRFGVSKTQITNNSFVLNK